MAQEQKVLSALKKFDYQKDTLKHFKELLQVTPSNTINPLNRFILFSRIFKTDIILPLLSKLVLTLRFSFITLTAHVFCERTCLMKKIFAALFIVSMFFCTPCRAETTAFLTEDEIPTGAKFMPLPPKPTDASFYNDWQRYQWGKIMRNTERGQQAVADAVDTLDYYFEIYSEPFGLTISKENTPEISLLLERLLATTHLCNQKSKSRLMRARPFMEFNEPTPVPEDEEKLRTNSSYPSGHTTKGWAFALVLSEINPDRQDEILKRGFEYGESRVIVGFHFQSDVDAARVITSALVNRLHANEDFIKQLAKAKEEFLSKKALEE